MPWARCCTRRSRAGCRSAGRCSTCWRPSGDRSPNRRARSIRRCRPASSSSACSCWLPSRPTGPRPPTCCRMLGGGTAAPVVVTEPATLELIGRERHLETLQHAFRASVAGRPIWLFAHGPSGMGKSAVVDHFTDSLQSRSRRWCWRDAVTSRSRCATRRSTAWSMPSAGTWRTCRPRRCAPCCPTTSRCWRRCSRCSNGWTRSRRVPTERPAIVSAQELREPRVGGICRAARRAGRAPARGAGHRRPAVGRLGLGWPAPGHVQRASCPGGAVDRLASRGARRGQRVPVGAVAAGRAAGVRAPRTGDRRARACRRRTPGARPAGPRLPDGGHHGHAHRGGGGRQPLLHPRARGSRAGRVAAGRTRDAGRRHDARRGAAPTLQPPPQRVTAAAGRDCRGRTAHRRGRGLRCRRHR